MGRKKKQGTLSPGDVQATHLETLTIGDDQQETPPPPPLGRTLAAPWMDKDFKEPRKGKSKYIRREFEELHLLKEGHNGEQVFWPKPPRGYLLATFDASVPKTHMKKKKTNTDVEASSEPSNSVEDTNTDVDASSEPSNSVQDTNTDVEASSEDPKSVEDTNTDVEASSEPPKSIDFGTGMCVRDRKATCKLSGTGYSNTVHTKSAEYCEMWVMSEFLVAMETREIEFFPKLIASCDNKSTIDTLNGSIRGEDYLTKLARKIIRSVARLGYFDITRPDLDLLFINIFREQNCIADLLAKWACQRKKPGISWQLGLENEDNLHWLNARDANNIPNNKFPRKRRPKKTERICKRCQDSEQHLVKECPLRIPRCLLCDNPEHVARECPDLSRYSILPD